MRYYIRADLKVKLESSLLFPGSFDFQIGAILVDGQTASLCGSLEPLRRLGELTQDSPPKELPSHFQLK